jgi:hypothetical protein
MKNFIKFTEIESSKVLRININNIICYNTDYYSRIDNDDVRVCECIRIQLDTKIHLPEKEEKVKSICVHGLIHEFDAYFCSVRLEDKESKIDFLESLV